MNSRQIFILISILALISLSGCVRSTHVRGTVVVPAQTHTTTVITHYDPPPHAPAHGYRYRYYDYDLEYYSDLGAYVVIGTPGLYFYGGNYLRFINGVWQFSIELGKPWRPALERHVPRRLYDRYKREQRLERRDHRYEERHEHRDHRHKPPRHGHRRHHDGYNLTYDAGIGAYRISKQPGIYFYNDRYIRFYRGKWLESRKLNGKWRTAREQYVPRKLWQEKARKIKKQDRREPEPAQSWQDKARQIKDRDRREIDYRDDHRRDDRRSERHRHENRRDDDRRDNYRRDDRRSDRQRYEDHRDSRRDDDRRNGRYRDRDDDRSNGRHRDRGDDNRRDKKRRDRDDDDRYEERHDDGKQFRGINEKFFQGLQ